MARGTVQLVGKAPRAWLFVSVFGLLLLLSGLALSEAYAQRVNCAGQPVSGSIPDATRCIYLPQIGAPDAPYTAIPVMGTPLDRPAASHGDVNLALRSYIPTTATLSLIDKNGPTDADAPQLTGLFAPLRLPTFAAAYKVHNWDWACGNSGCRTDPIAQPDVTLLAIQATQGEAIHIPLRTPNIYAGGYKAMVLYAEDQRITFTYTREDTPAIGYLVHLEDLRVDPNLVALYRRLDAAGRTQLPALRIGERLGNALDRPLKVAIRDTGSFMEPRSRKDWWLGY